METCVASTRPSLDAHAWTSDVLTRAEFDTAVRAALRHYTRTDLMVGNPLMHTRIAAQRGAGPADMAPVQQMLTEAASQIFASTRDQKLLRVLELTYFTPAPKQEVAAERLGLSFSTYRRHLTSGIGRITEWLWRHEEEAQRTAPAPTRELHTWVEPTNQSDQRPRLSLVVLPFLNLSRDANLDYLVDGIVDSLTTDLSWALPGSFIISRSTAFTYKNRQVPIRQIGEELRVRYVLRPCENAGSGRWRCGWGFHVRCSPVAVVRRFSRADRWLTEFCAAGVSNGGQVLMTRFMRLMRPFKPV